MMRDNCRFRRNNCRKIITQRNKFGHNFIAYILIISFILANIPVQLSSVASAAGDDLFLLQRALITGNMKTASAGRAQSESDTIIDIANIANWKEKKFAKGSSIISMGEMGNSFYIIKSGMVNAVGENGKRLAQLREGDYFGELALLLDIPRSASIISETDVELIEISRDEFLRVITERHDLLDLVLKLVRKYENPEIFKSLRTAMSDNLILGHRIFINDGHAVNSTSAGIKAMAEEAQVHYENNDYEKAFNTYLELLGNLKGKEVGGSRLVEAEIYNNLGVLALKNKIDYPEFANLCFLVSDKFTDARLMIQERQLAKAAQEAWDLEASQDPKLRWNTHATASWQLAGIIESGFMEPNRSNAAAGQGPGESGCYFGVFDDKPKSSDIGAYSGSKTRNGSQWYSALNQESGEFVVLRIAPEALKSNKVDIVPGDSGNVISSKRAISGRVLVDDLQILTSQGWQSLKQWQIKRTESEALYYLRKGYRIKTSLDSFDPEAAIRESNAQTRKNAILSKLGIPEELFNGAKDDFDIEALVSDNFRESIMANYETLLSRSKNVGLTIFYLANRDNRDFLEAFSGLYSLYSTLDSRIANEKRYEILRFLAKAYSVRENMEELEILAKVKESFNGKVSSGARRIIGGFDAVAEEFPFFYRKTLDNPDPAAVSHAKEMYEKLGSRDYESYIAGYIIYLSKDEAGAEKTYVIQQKVALLGTQIGESLTLADRSSAQSYVDKLVKLYFALEQRGIYFDKNHVSARQFLNNVGVDKSGNVVIIDVANLTDKLRDALSFEDFIESLKRDIRDHKYSLSIANDQVIGVSQKALDEFINALERNLVLPQLAQVSAQIGPGSALENFILQRPLITGKQITRSLQERREVVLSNTSSYSIALVDGKEITLSVKYSDSSRPVKIRFKSNNGYLTFQREGGSERTISTEQPSRYQIGELDIVITLTYNGELNVRDGSSRRQDIAANTKVESAENLSPVNLDKRSQKPQLLTNEMKSLVAEHEMVLTSSLDVSESFWRLVEVRQSESESEFVSSFFNGIIGEKESEAAVNLSRALSMEGMTDVAVVMDAILNGNIDKLGAAERKAAYRAIFVDAEIWADQNGELHTFVGLISSKDGPVQKYFGGEISLNNDIVFASDSNGLIAEIARFFKQVQGKTLTENQLESVSKKFSDGATGGINMPYGLRGRQKGSRIIINLGEDGFAKILTSLLHELGHNALNTAAGTRADTDTALYIHEGIAEDFAVYAVEGISSYYKGLAGILGNIKNRRINRVLYEKMKLDQYRVGFLLMSAIRQIVFSGKFDQLTITEILKAVTGSSTLKDIYEVAQKHAALQRIHIGPVTPWTAKADVLFKTEPQVYVLPQQMFDINSGVNYADTEFIIYYAAYIKGYLKDGKKVTFVVHTQAQKEALTTLLKYSILTPDNEFYENLKKLGYASELIATLRANIESIGSGIKSIDKIAYIVVLEKELTISDANIKLERQASNDIKVSTADTNFAVTTFNPSAVAEPLFDQVDLSLNRRAMSRSSEIEFFGVADGFSADEMDMPDHSKRREDYTNFAIWIDGRPMFIDMSPTTAMNYFKQADPVDVPTIFLTHTHSDHDGGTIAMILKGRPINLVCSKAAFEGLKAKALALLKTQMEPTDAEDTFNSLVFYTPADPGKTAQLNNIANGLTIETRFTKHPIATTGFKLSMYGAEIVGYSADTSYDEQLASWLMGSQVIIHESGVAPIHASPAELKKGFVDKGKQVIIVHSGNKREKEIEDAGLKRAELATNYSLAGALEIAMAGGVEEQPSVRPLLRPAMESVIADRELVGAI